MSAKYRLVLTCGACPEQYDVFDEAGQQVGYMRLRHGNFVVSHPDVGGDSVYCARPRGDGIFMANERQFHLTQGIMMLHRRITVPPTEDGRYDEDGQKAEQWIEAP
jgi:hypothetical protein